MRHLYAKCALFGTKSEICSKVEYTENALVIFRSISTWVSLSGLCKRFLNRSRQMLVHFEIIKFLEDKSVGIQEEG